METAVRTPKQLFNLSQRLSVPLFQRRYVWEEEHQWQPLWDDITRTAELRSQDRDVAHFLGAAVLQASRSGVGDLPTWSLIDGQQRVTTLQVLVDATASVLDGLGETRLSGRLQKLTHNDEVDVEREEDLLKLRHENEDGVAFREVMRAEPPVEYDELSNPGARIVRAHEYFAGVVQEWLASDVTRAEPLADTLLNGLQVVAITLQADEDSQEIFETLNARGTPLTAADLIKNLLIQRVQAEGGNADRAYQRYWSPFESRFWEKEVSVGRLNLSRATLFLQQWLISRVAAEVPQNRLFPLFKDYVDHRSDVSTLALMEQVAREAENYRLWVEEAQSDVPEPRPVALSFYRYAQTDTEVAKPLIIWLHDPRRKVPQVEIDRAMALVESWIMRRMLLRATSADLGRVVGGLIASLDGVPVTEVGSQVERYLTGLNAASTYWPGDQEIRSALATAPAYRTFRRQRLRMMLEAVEDDARGFELFGLGGKSGARVRRGSMHIEHLLPRGWKDHWATPDGDLAAEVNREAHVHRLGNLTLLTRKLNSSVSNRAWAGDRGKYAALADHDDNLATKRILKHHRDSWNEETIDERTASIIDALLRTWPVPDGHTGQIADSLVEKKASVSVKDLVASGFLEPGERLRARSGDDVAEVTSAGKLRVKGKEYNAPSGAGQAVTGSGVNGWWFWLLPDGRTLDVVRQDYRERRSADGL